MTLQIVQIVCAIGIVAAFASLQFGLVQPRDPRYLLANLVSSAGLAITAVVTVQLGFVITNVLWVLVSAAGLLAIARNGRDSSRTSNT